MPWYWAETAAIVSPLTERLCERTGISSVIRHGWRDTTGRAPSLTVAWILPFKWEKPQTLQSRWPITLRRHPLWRLGHLLTADRHVAFWSWYRGWLQTALCQNRFFTSWSSHPRLTWRENIDRRSCAMGGKETRLPVNLSVTWVPNSLFVVQTKWAAALADSLRDCGQRTSKYGTQFRHRTGNLLIKNYDSDSCPVVYIEAEVNTSLYGQNVTNRRCG